eukprot:Hpha_TRINITY_DN7527_c0_g1::TRINITY_DN7527_c0_g1_i3::g.18832::m.18832
MPLTAWADVLVNFQQFRNIDLPEQGLYFVSCTCKAEGGRVEEGQAEGRLLRNVERSRKGLWPQERRPEWPREKIEPDPAGGVVCTTAIRISLQDQNEILTEAALFRVPLPVDALRPFGDTVLLRFDLHFLALSDFERITLSGAPFRRDAFEKVSTREVPVRNALLPHTQWLPVMWDWAAVAEVLVHTAAVGFSTAGVERAEGTRMFGTAVSYLALTLAVSSLQSRADTLRILEGAPKDGPLRNLWDKHRSYPVAVVALVAVAAVVLPRKGGGGGGDGEKHVDEKQVDGGKHVDPFQVAPLALQSPISPGSPCISELCHTRAPMPASERVSRLLSAGGPAVALPSKTRRARCPLRRDWTYRGARRGRYVASWLGLML